MKHFTKIALVATVVAFAGAWLAVPAGALDQSAYIVASTAEEAKAGVDAIGGESTTDLPTFIKTVINLLLFIIGVIAVIYVIIGGIKYVTSNGDAAAVKSAKDTILYAIIGIVVAVMAYAIVNWIINALIESSNG